MGFPIDLASCPKCDYGIFEQNRGKTFSRDIAHNHQTIEQATREFYSALDRARSESYGQLRLIVGGGLIKEEVGQLLETEKWRGNIQRYELEHPNTGAYLIRLNR